MRYIVEFSDGNGGTLRENADEGYVEAVRIGGWQIHNGIWTAPGRDTDGESVTLYRYAD